MLTTTMVLDRLNIRRNSVVQGCQDVGNMIRDASNPLLAASKLFNDVLGVEVRFDDEVFARIASKAMIQEVISVGCEVDEPELFVESAKEYATDFCSNPKWSFLWSKPEEVTTTKPEVVSTIVEGIDIKVPVKADGTIKKGGKQILAFEMYEQYVLNAEKPLTNQEFIGVLMDKLGMSKAGSTTYAYNAKKHYGK